jgi:FeS assembly SUF system regulator
MLKLGKLTDYAIVVMVQLAREGENAARSASHLADKTALPEPTVAKVLKTLLKENLVSSVRGAQGGYKLARDPMALSVCDIVEAMDGPIAIVSCVEGSDDACPSEQRCPTKGKWDPVNRAIRGALQELSLADMMSQQQSGCGTAVRSNLVQVKMPEMVKA